MGAGPNHLLEGGLAERLAQQGHDVVTTTVVLPAAAFLPEIQAAFEIDRRLAACIAEAVAGGAFPFVLAGNCMTSVGTISGVAEPELGVIWFDAHGDFNTPETTQGGFLDGMALAAVTGRCWHPLTSSVPGFSAVAEKRVMMVGARDLDAEESEALKRSEISRASPETVRDGFREKLEEQRTRMRDVYLHIDLDVLDPSEGKVNGYSTEGGLTANELRGAIEKIAGTFRIRAAALTAYDPSCDNDGRVRATAISLAATVIESVSKSGDAGS